MKIFTKRWSVLFFFALPLVGAAQEIKNVRADFDGEKVVIAYDLEHDDASQKFTVALYSSHNNYQKPLSLLVGDVGDNIIPGVRNRIVWDAKSVLPPNFDGDLTFKVKALQVGVGKKLRVSPLAQTAVKRGKNIEFNWTGGATDDKVTIELLKDNQVQQQLAGQLTNTNKFIWAVPKKSKKGKDYTIRISSTSNPTELASSQTFTIKPKTPFIVKFLPILALGGAAIFLGGNSGGGDGGGTLDDLPGPVKPN